MLASTVLKRGKGTPLVFLHGFLGTSEDWEPLCSHLPAAITCIGIDLPGHGRSPFTPHFCEEMPRLNHEPVHLIGYSMGARLAMQYQRRFPERVATLTLLSAHPGLTDEEEKRKRVAHDQKWAERLLREDLDTFLAAWYAQPIFGGFTPDLAARKRQNREALAQALTFYSLGHQPYYRANARHLVGERDLKFRALHPDAAIIPGAAHAIHLENPAAVAEPIAQALFG